MKHYIKHFIPLYTNVYYENVIMFCFCLLVRLLFFGLLLLLLLLSLCCCCVGFFGVLLLFLLFVCLFVCFVGFFPPGFTDRYKGRSPPHY